MDGNTEAQTSESQRKEGGWITFPFIIGLALSLSLSLSLVKIFIFHMETGSLASLTLASGGWGSNLIIYLIKEFNIKSINATLIASVINGCISIFPVAGAVIADSFLGSFIVISISSCISLLGIVALTLTATIDSLRPEACDNNGRNSCESPSKLQYSILYLGIILACIGSGGARFTTAALGANQFKNTKDQNVFFNWFIFALYAASVVSSIGIVYIEDNVSWGLGFGICIAANFIGLLIFLLGKRFYLLDRPQGSPFMALARVPVAAIRKRLAEVPVPTTQTAIDNYYYGEEQGAKMVDTMPGKSFRCLNRAALITRGDVDQGGSIAKPWRLCKVEEVEDFKTLLRLFPIWSAGIFLSTPIAIQGSLIILQALTMDRHLGPNFKIPPGSFVVIILISTNIFLTLIDRVLYPLWHKWIGKPLTPLQRIGLGHIFNALSMAVSAFVESKRLKIAHHLQGKPDDHHAMLSLWLFPQLVLVGIGEAFHFPGQVGLYYQEFPTSLRSTATAMISMVIAISFYLSTALIDLIRRITIWLPDDINEGRLDNVYWMIFVVGVLNFGYYLVCANWYEYQNVENETMGDSTDKN